MNQRYPYPLRKRIQKDLSGIVASPLIFLAWIAQPDNGPDSHLNEQETAIFSGVPALSPLPPFLPELPFAEEGYGQAPYPGCQ